MICPNDCTFIGPLKLCKQTNFELKTKVKAAITIMVHKYQRKTMAKYTEAAMAQAVKDVRLKRLTMRAATKKYNVPLATLSNRLKGVRGPDGPRKWGGQLYLPDGLEEIIVKVFFISNLL